MREREKKERKKGGNLESSLVFILHLHEFINKVYQQSWAQMK